MRSDSRAYAAPWGIVLTPAAGAVLTSLGTVSVALNAQLLRRAGLRAILRRAFAVPSSPSIPCQLPRGATAS